MFERYLLRVQYCNHKNNPGIKCKKEMEFTGLKSIFTINDWSEIYCEVNACWVIFLQMTVNQQQNDADRTSQ